MIDDATIKRVAEDVGVNYLVVNGECEMWELVEFARAIEKLARQQQKEEDARIADARAMRCEEKTELDEDADEVTELRSVAWQFSVLAAEIRASGKEIK